MHDFQGHFPGLSRTLSFNFQNCPGPKWFSRTFQAAWEPVEWNVVLRFSAVRNTIFKKNRQISLNFCVSAFLVSVRRQFVTELCRGWYRRRQETTLMYSCQCSWLYWPSCGSWRARWRKMERWRRWVVSGSWWRWLSIVSASVSSASSSS